MMKPFPPFPLLFLLVLLLLSGVQAVDFVDQLRALEDRLEILENREAIREFIMEYEAVVNDVANGHLSADAMYNYIDRKFSREAVMAGHVKGLFEIKFYLVPLLKQFKLLRHHISGLRVSSLNSTYASVVSTMAVVGTYKDGQAFASSMVVHWELVKPGTQWKFLRDTGAFDFWVKLPGLWGDTDTSQGENTNVPPAP